MEEKYQYKNIKTNEIVEDFMAEDYVINRLGLVIMPKGENETLTLEQQDFIDSTVEWFFSGNWIKEELEEE